MNYLNWMLFLLYNNLYLIYHDKVKFSYPSVIATVIFSFMIAMDVYSGNLR